MRSTAHAAYTAVHWLKGARERRGTWGGRQPEQTIVTTVAGRTKRIGFASCEHLTGSKLHQVPAASPANTPTFQKRAAIAQAPIVVERDGSLVSKVQMPWPCEALA